jgi:hypothetical protein
MLVGEEIKLRGTGRVIVTDPTGKEKAYEAGPGRTVTLEPTKIGTWSYEWENGRTDTFPVNAATSLVVSPPEPMAAVAQDEDRDRLAALVDAKSEPVLSDDDLDAILSEAAVGDTYNFNAAAAAGWRVKAARAARMTSYSVGDMSVNAEQIFTHTMEMVNLYEGAGSTVGGSSRKQLRSVRVTIDYDERIQPTPFR